MRMRNFARPGICAICSLVVFSALLMGWSGAGPVFAASGTEPPAGSYAEAVTEAAAEDGAEAATEAPSGAEPAAYPGSPADEPAPEEWIVRWLDPAPDPEALRAERDEGIWQITELLDHDREMGISVVKPREGVDPDIWLREWSRHPAVRYIQPNHRVRLLARPNDELLRFQQHLAPIRAEQAWDLVTGNDGIIIALVDTGVDLTHPDLADNLVPGYNLIQPGSPPQDDHGHGTNVAGVLAAVGNNSSGVAGLIWKAKIMPIKALEKDGSGDELNLGRGIRHAVDNGARIVVLSLGLYKYSNYLQEIVQYAEDRGVLLVAATGNDGQVVKYPAAYPTVLAVGGVRADRSVVPRSNFGPELDMVAPWNVFTTALGGGYDYNEGTSMAAPQAAAVAAMVWAQHPDWKPYQIRQHLRMTAEDLLSPGWDERTGYGLLRADRALAEEYSLDIYEPNNTRDTAKMLPIDTFAAGAVGGAGDVDWFRVEVPYYGELEVRMETDDPGDLARLELWHYAENGFPVRFADVTKPVKLPVQAGTSYLLIKTNDFSLQSPLVYRVTNRFTIGPDSFEDNDRQYKAYAIPATVRTLQGTFHQVNDQDWFVYTVTRPGTLQFQVTASTRRMDLAMLIQKEGERAIFVDHAAEGGAEISPVMEVLPGKYYVRVTNESFSGESHPVAGTYTLSIHFTEKLVDPNEPNNRWFQATPVNPQTAYQGLFDPADDEDWSSVSIARESYLTAAIGQLPAGRRITAALFDGAQRALIQMNSGGASSLQLEMKLDPGTYYLRLTADQPVTSSLYRLVVTVEPIVDGFRDVAASWARTEIGELAKRGIITGYGNYQFRPKANITRAEVAQILMKALGLEGGTAVAYRDLNPQHWAYSAVSMAQQAGIAQGYPDGTFRPDRPVTRAEMAAMLARAAGLEVRGAPGADPFPDVPRGHWAASAIQAMKAGGWLKGYPDGAFRPDAPATREEFAYLVYHMIRP